jgi:hypothetical protein
MTPAHCEAAEHLAGAIAIGEAGDAERDAYRAHVAACPRCLRDLGGEREIERVMGTVAQARDEESWQPDMRPALSGRRKVSQPWTWIGLAATLVVAILALRATQVARPVALPHPVISAQEARAVADLGTQSAPVRAARAESLAVGAATVSTAFELTLGQNGAPLRCRITKSSGDRNFDRSICRAALRARVR